MRFVVLVTLFVMFAGPVQAQSPGLAMGSSDPVFVGEKVNGQRSVAHSALARVEAASRAIWDPSSGGWFAAANGTLVQIADGGRLLVVADGLQGHDIDVRLAAGVAVSREPDDRIVLHRAGTAREPAVVLLEGPSFFHPRLSLDGTMALVHESRGAGSRIWLVGVETGAARVLCEGVAASWHPDGRRILFARIKHDSRRVLAGRLYEIDIATGEERLLDTPAGVAAVEPAVSPDGSQLAYVDALTGRLLTGPYPKVGEEVGHGR